MKLIFYRYFLYSFLALEVLLLPLFLEKELYATFEYYKFIIFFVPFFMLGAQTGYIYIKYNNKKDYFNDLIFWGSLHILILIPLSWIYFNNVLFLCLSFFIIVCTFIEHKLQTQKMFMLALSLKPLISVYLILSFLLVYFNIIDSINLDILFTLMLLSLLTWLFFSLKKINFINKEINVINYFEMIKRGFSINIGTLVLMAFFLLDRFIAKEYYNEYLATYSFSYNLIQFILLALSTLAYVNVIDVGEKYESINMLFFKQKLLNSYKIFLFLFLFFILFLFLISKFYPFPNLILYSLVMGIFLGNYFTINTMSSIALYLDFFHLIVKFMFYLLVANLILSYIFLIIKVDYVYFLIKTGVLLNISALYFYIQVRDRLDNDK